ncbi:methionyl-tRNA formyltransferase [Balneolaceae bacterium YR4-1]|uniref:Methionyl-tRNA formyltransferase n=1 Tax=Halalkalibaculum roseum TaxID=2709311 RepID=A0A6M1T0D2_9BACT|nr:formyltransferase family protein [Halalkalibaculum roseum]NGP78148.1 methionyl-tRNA formyltransferase [Halalkalibaculum roseum]
MNIGVITSGNLGYQVTKELLNNYTPVFLAIDIRSESLIKLAREFDIPAFIGNPRNGMLLAFLNSLEIKPDIILSINYLFLLDEELVDRLPVSINFHGSLLPKYRGRTPHVWAIINNEKKTGVTAHLIDKNCDTGAIVKQREINIHPSETGADILKKFNAIYPNFVKEVIKDHINDQLEPIPQDHSKATYFGKRTPEDGEINWNWQRERIYNWVRAQAAPYPGAYTFINNKKVIIDKVVFSDAGFSNEDPNGLILDIESFPVVKCPNGAIQINIIRNKEVNNCIKKGMVFQS